MFIEKYTGFKAELALADTFEKLKTIEAKAAAAAEFGRVNNIGKAEQDEWGEFRVQITQAKGKWLKENFPSKKHSSRTLRDEGITFDESADARLVSDEFQLADEVIREIKNSKSKIVTPSAVTSAIRKKKKSQQKQDQENISNSLDQQEESEIQIPKKLEPGWYKIGNQYLYFGSNLDDEFINKLPPCQFAFADPPYNAGLGEWDKDFVWEQDYMQDVAEVVAVTPGGWNAYQFYRQTEMNYKWEMACWIKNGMTHGGCGYANFIKTTIFSKGKVKIPMDFWSITIKPSETEDTDYKGRKPYDFMIHLIDMFSAKGGSIIDPFVGSGTTLLVSELMGRISYNAELQENMCIEIIKRALSKGMSYEHI